MNEAHLARMLDGTTVPEYLARLAAMAFLGADPARLEQLRRLPRYAAQGHVVLTRITSGAALFPSGRRGADTFRTIADFRSRDRPVELAVDGGVPDLARHLVRVQRWIGDEVRDLPWDVPPA